MPPAEANLGIATASMPTQSKSVSINAVENGYTIQLSGGKRLQDSNKYDENHVAKTNEEALGIITAFLKEN